MRFVKAHLSRSSASRGWEGPCAVLRRPWTSRLVHNNEGQGDWCICILQRTKISALNRQIHEYCYAPQHKSKPPSAPRPLSPALLLWGALSPTVVVLDLANKEPTCSSSGSHCCTRPPCVRINQGAGHY